MSIANQTLHILNRLYCHIVVIVCLFILPQHLFAQAIEVGYGEGQVLKFDNWLINDALKQQDAQSFWLGYIYQTHGQEDCSYAADFNYPTFTFGLLVADFNKVRLRYNPNDTRTNLDYESRCGTSYVAYASIRRTFFRTKSGWSADYRFSNGIGYNTRIYNRYNNVDNVLLGSRLAVYFDVALALNYHYRLYEFFIGPEFRHLSNGGVMRPNKGINKAGIGVGMRYHLQPYDSISFKRILEPFNDKKMYLNIAYSSGLRGSQGEWLYDANNYIWKSNNVEDIKYGKDGYQLCHYHLVSTDLMFRYARRYASGIGIDALYEPYNRDIEIQNPKADRSDMSKWSFGIAAKHEVFFRRISMQVALGWYLSRPLNSYSNTTEEYPYYERVGIRYNLPWLNNSISVGYNIYAHLTKAYGSELVIDFHLPMLKLR